MNHYGLMYFLTNNNQAMLGRIKRWILNETLPQDKANCIFCNNTFNNSQPIHYQDQHYFVITDINQASSVKHILVITKQHIANALHVQDASIIKEMKVIGQKVLNSICDKLKIQERKFRFGFHLPPTNSIDHLHLHCFIEPLQQYKYNKIFYGYLLNSVEGVLEKLQSNKK